MSDTTYIGRRMRRFDSSPQFDGFSKVVIIVSDTVEYSAGDDTGRTMRLNCPWGTTQMAQNILNSIRGYQYQPYTAEDAIIDPAAELGDGVTANNIYGGIFTQKIRFGSLLTATVAAPEDEEINHEYPYKSKPNKEITREARMLRAELKVESDRITAEVAERKSAVEELTAQLKIQAGLIEAKVSKTGGNASSFGWTLDESSWTIKSNGRDVLKATQSGLEIYGKITATSGKIGGFDIQSNYLSYNNQGWGGTNSTGIYIGSSGIQLGKNFKVDNSGNLTAASGTFSGSVYAGNIQYGGSAGYLSGGGISSGSISGNRLVGGTITTAYTSSGINSSLGYADFANGVFNDWNEASCIRCSTLRVNGTYFGPVTLYYTNASGGTSVVTVLGYR